MAYRILSLVKFNVTPNSSFEDLILKFSLILLVLDGSTGWGLDVFMRIICVLMLAFNKYTSNKFLWLLIAILLLFFNSLQFYNIDNHKILFVYWVLLITVYLWTNKDIEYLRLNSKLLIGLVMFFAAFQKIINEFTVPGFLHGSFLIDGRFMLITHFITDVPYQELLNNRNSTATLSYLPINNSNVTLTSSTYMGNLLYTFQIFGLIYEGLVASLFLFSKKESVIKDIALVTFCVGTYFIFPVIGFSSILLILGISQSNVKFRKYYIFTFILLQFIIVPWQELIFYFKNSF
ncbi:hypothetical protein [Parapedobacter koreensis]|uniref:Uncharacterized protein n=1 Tax=Parapedobacter koreensis TaxID=332977 RepID=A0A1H7QV72_9SPHI|nr:hypothetical protein [Parapedobacter koreensis]SEL51866.1 hypothetical protein SAMN05421740_106130 [Parapedobacter koreensis]